MKKKWIGYLSLATITVLLTGCATAVETTTESSVTATDTSTSEVKVAATYQQLNKTDNIQHVIQSVEEYATTHANYGNISYDPEKLSDALDVNFKDNPELPAELPRVVTLVISKHGCTNCHRLEPTVAAELLEATDGRINRSFGEDFHQTMWFEVQDDGQLPDWLTVFIINSGYKLDKIAVPSMMHMIYLKDQETGDYRWLRFDQADTTLTDENLVDRANLVYDTYFEALPGLYEEAFNN
ncbi:hypothetical protein [Vagococcus zengguangii]|uniref:Uncharacterized protein n=1 Tax=Vagococcus zengguangii TaxID=2571750 RepID=A0A4D7CP34_9ENTE|nr:hypothetical protein [Vagococcus zengguangii]QCI85828.1 hypothetical protein FA707_02095 [Vagococcus zengguangii]TLG81769.1 hypothetical protein FE258_01075 [Vagococcus zengguangii]